MNQAMDTQQVIDILSGDADCEMESDSESELDSSDYKQSNSDECSDAESDSSGEYEDESRIAAVTGQGTMSDQVTGAGRGRGTGRGQRAVRQQNTTVPNYKWREVDEGKKTKSIIIGIV